MKGGNADEQQMLIKITSGRERFKVFGVRRCFVMILLYQRFSTRDKHKKEAIPRAKGEGVMSLFLRIMGNRILWPDG